EYHPVAKQATIIIEKAAADLTIARSGFDPLLNAGTGEKTFDGTDYYKYSHAQVSIPTWFGVELNAGLENLAGAKTNPEKTIGKSNYVGLSLPLAQDLLMDNRRAALKTARLYRDASEFQRKNILNNLLLDAGKSYWQWVQSYQTFNLLREALELNKRRMDFVTRVFKLGDRAAIDTVEAETQLQSISVMYENAWMELQNARLDLSQYLWTTDLHPVTLTPEIVPEEESVITQLFNADLPPLENVVQMALKAHPELMLYNYKLNALDVDRRLKYQKLLPKIDFQYNQLGKGYDFSNTKIAPLFENNFRYSISLELPLRLSEGRGQYKLARLKIAETLLEQSYKRVEIETKVKTNYNAVIALKRQVALQEQVYRNYVRLQRAEETKFEIGESSLFFVNTRETKSLEGFQKLQEFKAKYFTSLIKLQWATGSLSE
ncbi:MAG: TolC family protein, partial [Chitinophagaceae bacterium]|nr:TolC family protein [Chitinophagaceae bacterium]